MSLISENKTKRLVYFDSKPAMQYWYMEILKMQGFAENPSEQYELVG